MNIRKIYTTVLLGACTLAAPAMATTNEELSQQITALKQSQERVKLTGFVTASNAQTDAETSYIEEGQTQYPIEIRDRGNFEAYNVLGLQFDIKVTDNTELVTQIKAQGRDGYNTDIEYAFLRMGITNSTDLRAGRLRLPFFMLSEVLDVGYAYPWVRPPAEVYNIVSGTSGEGLDIIHRMDIGDYSLKTQPWFSEARDDEFHVKNIGGLSLDLSNSWGSLHYGYSRGKMNMPLISGITTGYSISLSTAQSAANDMVNGVLVESFGSADGTSAARLAAQDATSAFGNIITRSHCEVAADQTTCETAWDGAYDGALSAFDATKTALVDESAQVRDFVLLSMLGGDAIDLNDFASPANKEFTYYATMFANPGALTSPTTVVNNTLIELFLTPEVDDFVFNYRNLGFMVETDRLLLMGEAVNVDVESWMPDTNAHYLTAGWRVTDTIMPHVTISEHSTEDDEKRLSIATGSLAKGFLSRKFDVHQESLTLGVRWDAYPGVALKAEVQMVDEFDGTYGLFDTSDAFFDNSEDYKLYRLSVDAVF